MAKKQASAQSPVVEVQAAVIAQLEEARKRVVAFEKELVKRGRAQQRELEGLIRELRAGKPVKQLEKQANAAGHEVKKRLDGLQDQVLGALGVASKQEITQLNRELARLSKKVDALVSRKQAPGAN